VNKIVFLLVLALASSVAASDFVSATHFFPIVSRTDGLAGTQWLTSLQIANPQPEDLVITARLSANGSIQSRDLSIAAGETLSWFDFLGDVFAYEGNGAVLLEAEAVPNGQTSPELRSFATSMRISTMSTEGGSFGQGVPSLDPVSGFLGDWIAYFPAVALWGQPGVEGFRTNVGFWNIGPDTAQIRLKILDAGGQDVWQQVVTAARHDPFVMALPRSLELETATLIAEPLNGWLDCAVYISVVDNITGDATLMSSQLLDPGLDSVGGAAQHNQDNPSSPLPRINQLRTLLLGEVR